MKKQIAFFIGSCIALTANAQIADSVKRKVSLQGAVNFRDIGGYNTTDGHHVKWGLIYRSADMSKLTDTDLAELAKRNIAYDVDFRGKQEAAQAPDRLNPNTDYILCPAGSDDVNQSMIKSLATVHGQQGDSVITAYYKNITYLADRYKPFFEKLLALPENKSLVYHCTAGKDRTGIGTALLLYSLGVPYQTIVNDYLASNYYRAAENEKSIKGMVQFLHIDEPVARDVLSVKKGYLDATFAAINQQYGSVNAYLTTAIGLDDAKIKLLRNKFLAKN
ncbi:tyrosine-protein phosphatase [Mucilaginibacter sp. HMF5004]|uniref:tyrosine-protein phosphatase n=1 Tax=Mucilaginibacter rivuli TaxID=2857527 RepID=UPI001C5F5A63|nr:tyrosine-protein phosphatase [Mucilaginibacter rivuli]MBW4891358.1 tyrosine-protein phosphatase [Mucilaginibacter rivuli]